MAERHLVVEVSSDASQYAWGGIIHNPDGLPLDCREFWREDFREQPIVVKEVLALVNTTKAGKSILTNSESRLVARPK